MDGFVRRNILGYQIAVGDVGDTAHKLADIAVNTPEPYGVSAADVHVLTRGMENPAYGEILQDIELICPDGMPIVKLLNRNIKTDQPVASRISGPDLMETMLGMAREGTELKHFLLGSTPSTLQLLTAKIQEKYPACMIAGSYSPPYCEWDENEYKNMADQIRKSGANVIWVGLGCPKQERWIVRCRNIMPPGIYLAVGAAFDFHAGTVKRAPLWMQRASLEWFYRLVKEPRRLFRRYFKYNTLFIYYLLTGRKVFEKTKPDSL